jgi:hypothetical protein
VNRIEAHHIVRKILLPAAIFDTGNGITLCRGCHKKIHAQFNRRPDLERPLGAEQGDDQDEWGYLFGLLNDEAAKCLAPEAFYYLGDPFLRFSLNFQGYDHLYDLALSGEISRIRYAYEVWRNMPELWYEQIFGELIRLNFSTDK